MKLIIDKNVKKSLPELTVFFKVFDASRLRSDFLSKERISANKLTSDEVAEYKRFRRKISGKTKFAVERLSKLNSEMELPNPDPLTGAVIKASYLTNLPITIFPVDSISAVYVRFSDGGEALETNNHHLNIRPGSVVADTAGGLLGIFGIKSSKLAKIKPDSKKIAVLSFGCNRETSAKCQKLIDQIN